MTSLPAHVRRDVDVLLQWWLHLTLSVGKSFPCWQLISGRVVRPGSKGPLPPLLLLSSLVVSQVPACLVSALPSWTTSLDLLKYLFTWLADTKTCQLHESQLNGDCLEKVHLIYWGWKHLIQSPVQISAKLLFMVPHEQHAKPSYLI